MVDLPTFVCRGEIRVAETRLAKPTLHSSSFS